MSPELLEVRLRYRPVGGVLTGSVRGVDPNGRRHQASPDDDTVLEFVTTPQGDHQLVAFHLLDTTFDDVARRSVAFLPEPLRRPVLDLLDPGRHHHGHPSTHRPTTPLTVHEATVLTAPEQLVLPEHGSLSDAAAAPRG